MKAWKCFKILTTREKQRSSTTIHDHEMPCPVANDGNVAGDNDEVQIISNSEQIDYELTHDSTEEFQLKSCLRFISFPTQNNKDYFVKNEPNLKYAKCWKRPQMYHVPTIPPKLWKIVAKLLGIPLYPGEKPYLATLMHVLTLASSLSFLILYFWHVACTISSSDTGKTILRGTVEMTIYTFWALLVIYANKLAYRMLTHQNFVKYVKWHCKTILKCKAGYLITFLGIFFSVLTDYDTVINYQAISCESVNLNGNVCLAICITRIVFSVFAALWNLIVALLILSVCRTHCLEIRQFIKELEKDALAHDEIRKRTYSTSTVMSNLMDDNIELECIDSHSSSDESNAANSDVEHNPTIYVVPASPKNSINKQFTFPQKNYKHNDYNEHPLKPADILHRFWKLQCSLRLSSSAFKRWTVCFMSICLMYLAISLITWLSQPPTPLNILLFLSPLLWFAIICSAIAEVNNEGQRTMRFICPTKDRLKMLIYLNEAPLQMTVYGFAIKYSNLVTSAIGLLAALMSGVVMQEIKSL